MDFKFKRKKLNNVVGKGQHLYSYINNGSGSIIGIRCGPGELYFGKSGLANKGRFRWILNFKN